MAMATPLVVHWNCPACGREFTIRMEPVENDGLPRSSASLTFKAKQGDTDPLKVHVAEHIEEIKRQWQGLQGSLGDLGVTDLTNDKWSPSEPGGEV